MWFLLLIAVLLCGVSIYDLVQKKHAILRNFPVLGHFRYLFEQVGPELRQYIVTSNDEERPFSRDQRTWVYASAKQQNNYFGFGTDNDLEQCSNYLIIKHSAFPLPDSHSVPKHSVPKVGEGGDKAHYEIPCAKVLGAWRGRKHAFRPSSIVNISAMSFGSLSRAAVEALNRGAKLAGCLHNTGEGGVSRYHQCGGELIWQIGTGYFGCRDSEGCFDFELFRRTVEANPIRAIEVKLSQGAKPGLGGVLPKEKITREIACIRGIEEGVDCISPANHSVFSDVDSMLDFVEQLAEATGLPVGIKSAVGDLQFWRDLARAMVDSGRGVDFVTIDGGEGGTGAGPLVFTDHVALPFKLGMSRVYKIFAEAGLHEKVVFVGSGKLGFPESAVMAMGLGCDLISLAREPMMAIGCIQAQRCHTGHCPTGVATQRPWLVHGLDPASKSVRFANYIFVLRKELLRLSHACGVLHPALIGLEHLEILDDHFGSRPALEVFGYQPRWGLPSLEDGEEIAKLMVC
jgi:glutamate synthase (ferredoxin)